MLHLLFKLLFLFFSRESLIKAMDDASFGRGYTDYIRAMFRRLAKNETVDEPLKFNSGPLATELKAVIKRQKILDEVNQSKKGY